MPREVKIIQSDIPGPYNLLSLPSDQSIEFTIDRIWEGVATREISGEGLTKKITGPILRVYFPAGEFVLGSPYIDILAGRTIAAIKTIASTYGPGTRVRLTAKGIEPDKFYSIEVLETPKKK